MWWIIHFLALRVVSNLRTNKSNKNIGQGFPGSATWKKCRSNSKVLAFKVNFHVSPRIMDTCVYIYTYIHTYIYIYIHMGLRQNSGMDRPPVIQTYGSLWITCVLVWMGGMDRPVGSGYGSGLYILTCSHYIFFFTINRNLYDEVSGRYQFSRWLLFVGLEPS